MKLLMSLFCFCALAFIVHTFASNEGTATGWDVLRAIWYG